MILLLLTLGFLTLFLASGFVLLRWADAYEWFRRPKLVHCPVRRREAAVMVAPVRAAWAAILHKETLEITDCGLWPENKMCGRECRQQLMYNG